MADDITLTVRVRDMTKGEFADIRRRMKGMDGDIRRVGQASQAASERADRLSRNIRGLSGRMGQLHRTGRLAGTEMTHMRRTMGLLGRDLRQAARSGEITGDEFDRLRDTLERTRLEFDYLDRDIRRHSAVAQRRAREDAARQREAQQMGRQHAAALRVQAQRDAAARREEQRQQMAHGQQLIAQQRRLNQAHAAALREQAARDREARRQQMAHGAQIVAQQRRINRAHDAALREQAARDRQAVADRQQAANRMAAVLRQQESDFRQHARRLASVSDADQGLTNRFQGTSDGDLRRMARAITNVGNAMDGVSGSNGRARRTANALTRDLRVMGQVLQNATRDGRMSQREFNALSRGLTQAAGGARTLRRAMGRAAYRETNREIALLRAQLRLLGNEGRTFDRLNDRLLVFQRRLRDTRGDGNFLRRSMSRLGDGMAGGMRGGLLGVAAMIAAMRKLGSHIKLNRRWTAILLAVLVLLGPAAQALGALLIAALGGAFVALGAFALRGSTQVRSAFQSMKSTLDEVLKESALPLQDAMVAGLHQVAIAARRMQPALTGAFKATAPLVDDVFGAVTDLVAGAMPGFTRALSEAEPAMLGFRTAMGQVGQGLGDMFAAMTANGGAEALQEVWINVGAELKNFLVGLGEFINFSAKSGTATMLLIGFFRTFSGLLNIVQAGLKAFDTLLGGVFMNMADHINGISGMTDGVDLMGGAFVAAGQDVKSLKKQLADVDKRIADIKKKRGEMLIKGPAKEHFLAQDNASDKDLKGALAEREALLGAISAAERDASSATRAHATAVKDLITQIQSLAEQNRNHLDAQSAQEQAIADATKKATKNQKKWSDALSWSNGQLVRNGQAGRDSYEMLSKIASTTKEATDKAIEANAPWSQITQRWNEGRDSLIKMSDGWGLNKTQAKELADQILGMPPSKEIVLKARTEEAIASFDAVIAAMLASPDAKTITVTALSQDAQRLLEDIGFKVERLPNGEITITAKNGQAIDKIGAVKGARDALKSKEISLNAKDASTGVINSIQRLRNALTGKTITITTVHRNVMETIRKGPSDTADALRRQAERFGASGGAAGSLPMKRFAGGGNVAGGVLDGPGTKTSDSLVARLSRGEFVMRAAAVDKYGPAFMQRINLGLLPKTLLDREELPGFAKGGKPGNTSARARSVAKRNADAKAAANKRKAQQKAQQKKIKDQQKRMRDARNALVPDLTISHFGKMAGYKDAEFVSQVAKSDTMKDVVSGLNKMRSGIKKATSGSTESRLLKQLDSSGRALINHQKKLITVNKALEKAKTKLDDLKGAASQLKDSVKQGIIGELNMTRSASREDSQVTINTIMSQMTADASQAKQFQSSLATLKKRGVSGRVLEQIAQAGVEGGGLETATALLGASSDQIKRINELNASIRKSADDAGDVAADAMYAAGIKAAEGLVKGLKKQQDAIEKQMLKIAKAMEKAIKKALGIKSPSKVMEVIGRYTAEGFALGIEQNSRPQHAWESMLTVPAQRSGGSKYTPTPTGGGGPMVIQLHIGGTNIGELVIDPLRKSIRHRGGNVQAVLGK